MRRKLLLLALLLAACPRLGDDDDATGDDDDTTADDDDTTADDDDTTADDDDSGDDDDSSDDDDSGDDDDDSSDDDDATGDDDDDSTPPPPVFDCATAPSQAISDTIVPGARGYHGLAIDRNGFMVGSDGGSLIRADYAGNWAVYVPGIGAGQQMDYLLTGDLIMAGAASGGLVRVTPAGGQSAFGPGIDTYGLRVAPDGDVWIAGSSGVFRIGISTGVTTTIATLPDTPHSFDWSPDFTRIYIGTIGSGQIYAVDLDATMSPISAPYSFATVAGSGWHDGVAVDACGYLYVADYSSSSLYRVAPSGGNGSFLDWSGTPGGYGHGTIFGKGVGGFREDALYLPMPYNGNTVKEVVVGVPRRDWGGIVVNAP